MFAKLLNKWCIMFWAQVSPLSHCNYNLNPQTIHHFICINYSFLLFQNKHEFQWMGIHGGSACRFFFFNSKCKTRLLFICLSKHWFQSAIRIMAPARIKVRWLLLRRANPAGSHQSTLTGSTERMEETKRFPSCSFHKNKDWCSSGVCLKLKMSTYFNTHSLKYTLFLASQKQWVGRDWG